MYHEKLQRWFEGWQPTDPFVTELFDRRKAPAGRRVPAQAASGRSVAIRP